MPGVKRKRGRSQLLGKSAPGSGSKRQGPPLGMPDPGGPKRVGALGGAVASTIGSLGKSRNGPVLMVPPVPKRSPPAPPLPWPAPPVFVVAPEEELPVSPPPPLQEAAAMTGAEHAEASRSKRREALFMG